jgi:hypothetical protein
MRLFKRFFAIIQYHPLLQLVACLVGGLAFYHAGAIWPFSLCLGFAAVVSLEHLIFPLFNRSVSRTSVNAGSSQKEFQHQLNSPGIFTYSDTGFTVEVPEQTVSVDWQDIRALFGYKEDLYTIDRICLDVHHNSDSLLRLTEELPGWHQFQFHIARHFYGIEWSWQVAIATPAFAPNLTLLYERKGLSLAEAFPIYYPSKP